jgi:hypothetical protein
MDYHGDKFVAKDGSLHETRDAAEGRNASNESSDAFLQALGPLVMIFMIVPIIIAGAFGFVWGALFKAGIVGRIIQSAIVGLVSGAMAVFIMAVPAMYLLQSHNISLSFIVKAVFVVTCCALPALWYYYSHYFSLQAAAGLSPAEMPKKGKKGKSTVSMTGTAMIFAMTFAILFWGGIVTMVIPPLLDFFNIIKLPEIILFIFYIVPVLGAFIYYANAILKYREDAKHLKSQTGSPKYGALASIVLAGIIAIQPVLISEKSIGEAIKNIKTNYVSGATLIVWYSGGGKIYEKADKNSAVVKELKTGDRLTSTGTAEFDRKNRGNAYIPVNFNGVKGYIYSDNVYAVTQTASAKQGAVFYQKYTYYDKDGHVHAPKGVNLNGGEKVEIVSVDKKKEEATAFYDGHYGGINLRTIEMFGADGKKVEVLESIAIVKAKTSMDCRTCQQRGTGRKSEYSSNKYYKDLNKGDTLILLGKAESGSKKWNVVFEGDTGAIHPQDFKLPKKQNK